VSGFIDAVVALGGFGGCAAFITAIAGVSKIKRVEHNTKELKTNHGSSLRDAVNRIEKLLVQNEERLDKALVQIKGLGHQVGEVKKDMESYRREQAIQDEDVHARMRNLELKTDRCKRH